MDFAKLKNLLSICLSLFLRNYLSKYLSEFCEYGPRALLLYNFLLDISVTSILKCHFDSLI